MIPTLHLFKLLPKLSFAVKNILLCVSSSVPTELTFSPTLLNMRHHQPRINPPVLVHSQKAAKTLEGHECNRTLTWSHSLFSREYIWLFELGSCLPILVLNPCERGSFHDRKRSLHFRGIYSFELLKLSLFDSCANNWKSAYSFLSWTCIHMPRPVCMYVCVHAHVCVLSCLVLTQIFKKSTWCINVVHSPILSIPNPQLRLENEFIKYFKTSPVTHHVWVVSSYLSETLWKTKRNCACLAG